MKFLILFACIGFSVAAVVPAPIDNNQTKVINGVEIPISKALYHVSLQSKKGNHQCGGTIIDYDWVLTTAECALG